MAADGEEACQIASLHVGRISVAVLDLIMPRLGGLETAKRIKATDPKIQVVLCSGFASGLTPGDLPDPAWRLVQKPYSANELLRELRSAIDSAK